MILRPPLKAIVLDVYETLVDNSLQANIETVRRICLQQGLPVDPPQLWACWKAREVKWRARRVDLDRPERSAPFRSYQEVWLDCYRQVFSELGLPGDEEAALITHLEGMAARALYPQVPAFLHYAQGHWKTAVLSNADDAFLFPLLEHHRLRFDAVLSSEAARMYKPHPDIFRHMLATLEVEPQEALMVGDTQGEDILGARLVGMRAAWINPSGAPPSPELPSPDLQVAHLGELLERLRNHRRDIPWS